MKIGPLTTVDYDEPTKQITTENDTHVVIQDPDMVTTGYGMLIQLRKDEMPGTAGSSSGFRRRGADGFAQERPRRDA